jgi:hypothetical protein
MIPFRRASVCGIVPFDAWVCRIDTAETRSKDRWEKVGEYPTDFPAIQSPVCRISDPAADPALPLR